MENEWLAHMENLHYLNFIYTHQHSTYFLFHYYKLLGKLTKWLMNPKMINPNL